MSDQEIFSNLVASQAELRACVLCTVVQAQGSTPRGAGSKMIVFPDGRSIGTIGGGEIERQVKKEALKSLKSGTANLYSYSLDDPSMGAVGVCGGQMEVFVEPFLPKPELLIIGAGHVGKALAKLAKWLGYRILVSDDRIEVCNSEEIPEGDEFFPVPMMELPGLITINQWTSIVLTTRGVDIDIEGLPGLLNSEAEYIGVIGSKKRWLTTRNELIEKGLDSSDLNKVHSPIGLEINAETPEEIAVSIISEIIMIRRGGDGKTMQLEIKNDNS